MAQGERRESLRQILKEVLPAEYEAFEDDDCDNLIRRRFTKLGMLRNAGALKTLRNGPDPLPEALVCALESAAEKALQPPPKRACRRMKAFSLQDGIDKEGFFRKSEEAPQVIEMIKKGKYPLIADVRKAGKTTLKQEIVDLLHGQTVDTIRGESEVRVVAVTLGWGLEMHGQESETAFWKYVIDDVVRKSQGLLVRHPDTTDSAAGFASLFQWVRPTGPLVVLCVDEASELAKASIINRASLMHCFRDMREAATRRQHRLLSVAFFGTFTVLRIVDELNEGRPGPSGAIFRTSPFLLATGPEVIRGLRRFSIEDIVQLLEEYAELCREELEKRPVALQDLQRIAESIFEKTRGHKGQTVACLMALQTKQLLEKNLDGPLIVEQWLQYLRTDLPAYVAQSTVFRATVQSALQATPAQLELLSSVLYSGTATVPADQVQEIAEPLLAEGVLVEEAHGESSEFGYRRAAVAQAKSPPAPGEYLEYIDFLVIETVRNLNWATIACHRAANASGEPSEYALQGQFLLILNQLLRKTEKVQFFSLVAEARNITTTSGNVRRRIDFLCWPLPHRLGTIRPFAIELIAFAGRADILEHMRRGYPKLHAADVDGRVETCHTVVVHVSADWAAKRGAIDYFGPPEGVEDVHVVQVLFKENGAKARIAFEDRDRDREIPVAGLRKEAKMVLSKLTTPPSSTPGTRRPPLPQPR
ncbi:hypothetical protein KFL_000550380 [Klebsormidium nitens]|uniref:Uncharacterized protein n=1 Tax=Klebsormidium nitens TaxID=105231 RepID=A0A1Y1HTK2_KLENI|nr:hypothetical protein KFL_000550380 [Klebsormidium nitens]|eukprot:GAQ80509.1 hypothetical protein KFL_000550380 [Klebsormidium nitens]